MRKKIYQISALVFVTLTLLFQACSEDAYSDDERSNSNYGDRDASSTTTSYAESSTDLTFEVSNNGAAAYVFNNDDLNNVQNPDLTLKRGTTYTFTINAPGHPFFIKTIQGTTDANTYNEGVTNNGIESGTINFDIPLDAPDTLYYICEFHAAMSGVFTIED